MAEHFTEAIPFAWSGEKVRIFCVTGQAYIGKLADKGESYIELEEQLTTASGKRIILINPATVQSIQKV